MDLKIIILLTVCSRMVYGSYEEALADKVANAEFISASDKLNSITEDELNSMLSCSSFSEAESCDPTAITGTCKWCVVSAPTGLLAKAKLSKAKCPSQKSFPPKLRDTYKWVMAPQKFGKRRVCEAKEANPEIHDVLHAKSQIRAIDNALQQASSASIDGTDATNNSSNSKLLSMTSNNTKSEHEEDKHIFGLNRKILIFAASAGAFVVLIGLVVCISQR